MNLRQRLKKLEREYEEADRIPLLHIVYGDDPDPVLDPRRRNFILMLECPRLGNESQMPGIDPLQPATRRAKGSEDRTLTHSRKLARNGS